MGFNEKKLRKSVILAFRSKKKRTRKKHRKIYYEVVEQEVERRVKEDIVQQISLFSDFRN